MNSTARFYNRSYLTISGSICLLISITAHYLSVQNAVNTSINRKMGMLQFVLYKSMFSSLTHLPTDIYCVNSLCRRLAFKGGGSVVVDLLFNYTSNCLRWLSVCLFGMHYFISILVLQSS